jgi:hypothetical protein
MRTSSYKSRSSQSKRCSVRCPQRTGSSVATSGAESAETADATALGRSRPIDGDDFSSERPVLCAKDETGPNRILEYIVPLRGVTLIGAQQMIVKAWLPEGDEPLPFEPNPFNAQSGKRGIELSFQSFDPSTQSDFAAGIETGKEMHVVRHDHVASHADTKLFRAAAIIDERVMHRRIRKNALAPMGVEGHEENRCVEALEDQLETRRLGFDHSPHRRRCSVRCPQRTSVDAWRRVPTSAEDSGRYSVIPADRTVAWMFV